MLSAMKFSNDQRVLQSSPKVLRISLFLESSAGHYVTYTLVSLPAVAALVLAIASRLEAAARVIKGCEKESEEGDDVRRRLSRTSRVIAIFCDRKPVRSRGTPLVFFRPVDFHPSHLESRQRDNTSGSNAIGE